MKNKKSRIVIDSLLIILGIVFLIFGIKDLKSFVSSQKSDISDAEKFKSDYQYVAKDNSYKYIDIKELRTILDGKDEKIILVGSPLDSWTQVLVSHLDEYAKSIKKSIYYLDLDKVDKTSDDYKKILKKIKLDDITTPTVIIKTKSNIELLKKEELYDSNFTDAPIDYWTEKRVEELKEILNNKIRELK